MVIRGARVIDPASGTDGIRDVIIDSEVIKDICMPRDRKDYGADSGPVYDARGLIVAPGLVDPHVHMRDPGQTHKEDLTTGALAAAKGGFTSVILMGNTVPPVDNETVLEDILERGRKTPIRIYSCANVTRGMKGKELTDFDILKRKGAVLLSDDGRPITDGELMERACIKARENGMIISLHEEDPDYIDNNGIDTEAAARLGIKGSDRQAEISMVRRDIGIAEKTGAEITVQHISTAEAVELIRNARKRGVRVHAEATPHHFTLTSDAVLRYGSLAKMNPPLRSVKDRDAVRNGLLDGTIEMIATDHAPHTMEEKAADMFKTPHWAAGDKKEERIRALLSAPSGITGLETSFSLALKELSDYKEMDLMKIINCMSLAPAKIYGLDAGYLAKNGPADMVIFSDVEEWEYDKTLSRSANTPFMGETLPGRIYRVICRGKVIYDCNGDT